MWKILIPLLLLIAVIFIQLRRVEAFTDPACDRKPGAYSVRCTDGTVLDPQGAAVPSTCGYAPNITGVITDPNGGVCGSVPAACNGWAFNGAGVWTNFNLVSNTATLSKTGVGNRGTGGLSTGGYTGSYLGNASVDTAAISSQLGSIYGGYSGSTPTFGTGAGTPATTGATGTGTGTAATILPPTTTATTTTQDASGNATDASGNTVNTPSSGMINLSLSDLITLFGSTATGTSAPPAAAAAPSNNPAPTSTAGQDFYNQFRPMLLDDINKAIEAKAIASPTTSTTTASGSTQSDTSCSPSLQQGTDFSTAQNNIQYNQEYIRKDSIPCYACSL
jgi:hypothetical protein